MIDINKVFNSEQTKKIALQLTKSPIIIKNYTSALSRPYTPRAKIAQQEKGRE